MKERSRMAKGRHSISLFEVSRKDSAKGLLYKKPVAAPTSTENTETPSQANQSDIRVSRMAVFLFSMGFMLLLFGAYILGQRNAANQPIVLEPNAPQSQEGVTMVNNPTESGVDRPAVTSSPNPIAVNTPMGRKAGQNYIIVQSYPQQEKKMAEEALAILKENGVQSTIEKSPSRLGLPSGWVSVITTSGFEKISSPQYQDLVSKIESVSGKNIKRTSFKAFKPGPYKWDAAN